MDMIENVLLQRSSVRSYDNTKKIPQKDMDTILRAIQQSPTYISGQQYSVIVIDDEQKKKDMFTWTIGRSGEGQQYIQDCSAFLLFVMDFNKVYQISQYENMPLEITNYMEGLLIGSVDVGIGIEAATVCAESLGYGTVIIGAVRRCVKEIIQAYNLPKYTFPLLGLCVGYPTEERQPRPRLAMNTFAHYNTYELHDFEKAIKDENKAYHAYYGEKEGEDEAWSRYVAKYYEKAYRTELLELYKEQGFDIK